MADLGALGSVDHFANVPATISVGRIGIEYRVVRCTVINGVARDEPVDDRRFASVYDARNAANALRRQVQA